MKLGKTEARPDAVRLKFALVSKASALPTPPARFGHFTEIDAWGDLGNNDWGDCVWAGAAHEHMLWTKAGNNPSLASFTEANCLSDYSTNTGFAFTPATDQGTDMASAASYRRKTGVVDASGVRHKVFAYMALTPGNWDEMILASYLFGAVGVGIKFPQSAEDQFKAAEPWDVVPNSPVVGGHYIPVMGRNSKGNAVVITWGRAHAMTRKFYELYNDETVAYFSPEYVDTSKLSPEGFDMVALTTYLTELT